MVNKIKHQTTRTGQSEQDDNQTVHTGQGEQIDTLNSINWTG